MSRRTKKKLFIYGGRGFQAALYRRLRWTSPWGPVLHTEMRRQMWHRRFNENRRNSSVDIGWFEPLTAKKLNQRNLIS